jgi:hypothetical protein
MSLETRLAKAFMLKGEDALERLHRYRSSWPLLAGAGVTVARPSRRVLARPGGRDLVPRIPGRWRFLVLARRSSGTAWSVALTTRSSGRVRVTPSRRRALKPWARRPTTVAAARCRVTFFDGVRAGTAKSTTLTAKRFGAPLQYQ